MNSFEGSREWRRGKKDKVFRREEKAVSRKTGTWKFRRRSRIRRSWTSRGGGGCRSRYEKLRNLRTWIGCSGKGRKRNGRRTCKRLRTRGTSFCLSTRRCRRGHKRCKVCRIRRRIISRTPVRVMKRCQKLESKPLKERHVSWSGRRSRATVGRRQMIWKKKLRTCRQERKEEAVVRRN